MPLEPPVQISTQGCNYRQMSGSIVRHDNVQSCLLGYTAV
jgi:hypothetical protein